MITEQERLASWQELERGTRMEALSNAMEVARKYDNPAIYGAAAMIARFIVQDLNALKGPLLKAKPK